MLLFRIPARSLLPKLHNSRAVKLAPSAKLSCHTFATTPAMHPLDYNCDIPAEPIDRYQAGGYHPILLGDVFQDGRYKILHKLGWGGFSTVWAARDRKNHTYVALKVSVAKLHGNNREGKVLRTLSSQLRSREPGSEHIMQMLDHFHIQGPNGKHECLVFELVGPSVADVLHGYFNVRLPGTVAIAGAHQAVSGLEYLHRHGIGHGGVTLPDNIPIGIYSAKKYFADLHTRNLAFSIPPLHELNEAELVGKLGSPQIGSITRKDGQPLEPGIPPYLVEPASYPGEMFFSFSQPKFKLIDFGGSFSSDDIPRTLHTPLAVRAPEIIFADKLDYRVDLWSLGCLIFELIVGQPPIEGTLATPVTAVQEMLQTASDEMPERWQQKWRIMKSRVEEEEENEDKMEYNLQSWLEESYFDGVRKEDLSREEIGKLGALLRRLLRFEPATRASTQEILQDPFFICR